ncbi:MAG: carbohydrate ABC transporter permease [Anaerolineae bacterium]|nr:carbohydrate ABC transporter permease [Anaerolineae bacterium]
MASVSSTRLASEQAARRTARLRQFRAVAGWVVTVIGYILIAIVFATPMLWVITNSFRPETAIMSSLYPLSWKVFAPIPFTLFNYLELLGLATDRAHLMGYAFMRNLWVSLSSATLVVLLSLIFNTCAAFFFARLSFPGKRYLLVYVLATMMVPEQVVIVPLFLVGLGLGLINTYWALVVPFYASPFITFALMQFMGDLPVELDEAATIDGANMLQILVYVLVPNTVPAMITVSLLEFQFIWNNFYWPLVAISDKRDHPIQVVVAGLFGEFSTKWSRILAGMVFASVPIIVLFMFLQRYYYENIALTGMKG